MRQRVRRAFVLISLLLFPVTMNYLSPYVSIDGASRGILAGSILSFALMFVLSLALGRLWCGWACPAAGLAEACTAVNAKRVNGKRLSIARYIVWGVWASALAALLISAGGFKSINLLHMTDSAISVDAPGRYAIYLAVLAIFLALFLSLGRRGACHAICWMSPFMEAGGKLGRLLKLPQLHVKADAARCSGCGACTKKCPMSLDVKEYAKSGGVRTSGCILCGECVDGCPKNALRYSFKG